ncbi:hypothetical protein RRG08_039467 [Elysia crispata]|uniref:Uncharacterized protein n=1 Tax=Elysia crispata TaxID=231223 RepID=A0AAE1D0P3_9GAST|nr:hypothetical protein RRG08_039467 [Elysia crispata]
MDGETDLGGRTRSTDGEMGGKIALHWSGRKGSRQRGAGGGGGSPICQAITRLQSVTKLNQPVFGNDEAHWRR